LRVEVIDRFDDLAPLRRDWDDVYDADPEASFFLSWTWMSHWLRTFRRDWFVLAASRDAGAPAFDAFWPLGLSTQHSPREGFRTVIDMAGNRHADYTGFICRPGLENEALGAFTDHIRTMSWADLRLEQIRASDERMRRLLSHFSAETFEIRHEEATQDGIDHHMCPFVRVPRTWDDYCAGLGSNTRQKVRRFLRAVDSSDALRIAHATADSAERDVDALLRLWQRQWGPQKRQRLQAILAFSRAMMMSCARSGALFLPVLWRGDTPVAALGGYVDHQRKSLLFFMGGRDETFVNPPPGFVLHAYSIRHAIENGFETYDFLRGNEPYKYAFGAEERRIRTIVVSTRDGSSLGGKLDRRSLPFVRQRTMELHKAHRLSEAERGYAQILELDPLSLPALYGQGQIMAATGRHAEAIRLFDTMVRAEPRSGKAWFRLARSLEATGQADASIAAFGEASRLMASSSLAKVEG
jgi:CelD/BcsL family acetyltransferase involved in cellulose biosynthesis